MTIKMLVRARYDSAPYEKPLQTEIEMPVVPRVGEHLHTAFGLHDDTCLVEKVTYLALDHSLHGVVLDVVGLNDEDLPPS